MTSLARKGLSCLLVFIFLASAQAAPPDMSLVEAVAEAVKRNPDIAAARSGWRAAESKVRSEKSLPNPSIGAEFMGFRGSDAGEAEEKRYDVSQTFPFPGKLHLMGKAAAHDARREEEIYEGTKRDVTAQVKEAYFNLMYAARAVQIYADNAAIMRRFARIAESKYSVGKASQSDVLRAQVELSKMENMAITSRQEHETARARLNALLDRRPEEAIVPTDEPAVVPLQHDLAGLEAMALENRPEIRASSHHIRHMDAEVASERAGFLPDTMLQVGRRKLEGRPDDNFAMVRLDLPFIWFWRQRSLLRTARFGRDHAEAALRSASTMTRYEVKEFMTHVETARRLVELYRTTILPQAEQSMKVTESAYQAGGVGFLDLLDSERALIDFRLEYYRSLADYGANLAHLERVVGVDFIAGSAGTKESHHE